ncbi:hypothetical protein GCM10010967_49660 [Dyadobacter beijingensis]|uniref:Uncharacterized protein n=1 Tax=Dyadobacter beijingensis TaxID=365489 RepID=A0ABQ2IIW0_9BACT|nr:hypothetical protein GCM10010967_49660 [Dyadobacter beijingensis]
MLVSKARDALDFKNNLVKDNEVREKFMREQNPSEKHRVLFFTLVKHAFLPEKYFQCILVNNFKKAMTKLSVHLDAFAYNSVRFLFINDFHLEQD